VRLEDQVAPFRMALRMREMGFPQNTEFHWRTTGLFSRIEAAVAPGDLICAAPTVAEMGEWLPAGDYTVRREDGDWTTGRSIRKSREKSARGSGSEAASRARSLIAAAVNGRLVNVLK